MQEQKKEEKKTEELELFLENFRKEFGEDSVAVLNSDAYKCEKEAISSGSIFLDSIMWKAGIGGYVKGKVIEISGLQSSGKSTLAFHAVRECQKLKEKVVYFDLENGLDMEYAEGIGIDGKNLILPYPNSGEEAFEMMVKFIEMNVGLIVVDSVSNLVPRAQLEANLEKTRIGSHASLMSTGLRKVKNKLINKKTVLIFINQLRHNINTGFFLSNQEVTTGGLALHYESDLRIKLRFKEKIEKAKKIIGIKIEAKVTKNRFSRPFGAVELEIIHPVGIQKSREVVKLAIENGVIQKNGNWYYYNEKKLGNGLEAVIECLEKKENQEILFELERKAIESLTAF